MDLLGPVAPDDIVEAPLNPSPDEIRDRLGGFPKLGRGYDPASVDTYLRRIADCLEDAAARNRVLADQVNDLGKKIAFHESRAWAVQDALVVAQTLRAGAVKKAEKEADRIRGQASKEAEALLTSVRQERVRIQAEVAELDATAERLRAEIEGALAQEQQAALDDAERIRAQARAEAIAHATRIRDHAKAEVELLRRDAAQEIAEQRAAVTRELEQLRHRAVTEVHALKTEALTAAQQIEDDALRDLEARSASLLNRIEERHAALERLEANRLLFLERLQAELERQLTNVERERSRAPLEREGGRVDLGGRPTESEEDTSAVPILTADEEVAPVRGILMPDRSVVLIGESSTPATGPKPITDGPSPLDPGVRVDDDDDDDDMPIAASDRGTSLDTALLEDRPTEVNGGAGEVERGR